MGLRTLLRTSSTLVATTVVAALLSTPSAVAAPCLNCEDPEIPDDPGVPCPTIAATTDPVILSPTSPTRPVVGQTVSASTGTWNANTKTLKAGWYVGDQLVGTITDYPTTDTRILRYTVRPDDHDKAIRLWVRGTGDQSPCVKSEYSLPTALVDLGPKPVNQAPPSLRGTGRVGETLTAVPGSWTNSPESYVYEWYREGTTESIGDGQTYELTAANLGKRIRVGVTAQRPGHWAGFEYSSYSAEIALGSFTYTSAPTITGSSVFGQTLTGHDGVWPEGTTVDARAWQRGNDGTVVKALGSDTYRLGLDDIGHEISYSVRVTRPGYHPRKVTVSSDGPVVRAAAPVWRGKKVALTGRDKVGKRAKVALGTKKIRARASATGAKVSFQWLRNGKAIKGSTKRAHVIRKADRRKKLKVRIRIARPGHKALVVTTTAVKIKNSGKKIR